MLIGVELVRDRERREPYHELGARTTQRRIELGLSMNIRRRPERGSVWRIAPPLTAAWEEIDEGVEILDRALGENSRRDGAIGMKCLRMSRRVLLALSRQSLPPLSASCGRLKRAISGLELQVKLRAT